MELIDDPNTIDTHRNIIQKNVLLNSIYYNFYKIFKKNISKEPIVELGSGAGFIKKVIPEVITTDVIQNNKIDRVEFAEKLSFKKGSVGTFLLMNVLHHIKNPVKAFNEFERCLKNGGKIIMIEPSSSSWARIIYRNLHHENFDDKAGWKIKGRGRLSDANIALPYIIFERDRKKFEKRYSTLKIVSINYHSPLSYLLSGGLSRPQLFSWLKYSYIQKIENFLTRLFPQFSMFMTVVIEKV